MTDEELSLRLARHFEPEPKLTYKVVKDMYGRQRGVYLSGLGWWCVVYSTGEMDGHSEPISCLAPDRTLWMLKKEKLCIEPYVNDQWLAYPERFMHCSTSKYDGIADSPERAIALACAKVAEID